MAERKPTIQVVVEDDDEKKVVSDAAARAGYDNPGAYIRALLERDGVSLTPQRRGGYRGEGRSETASSVSLRAENGHSGVLCIEIAHTPE